MKRLVKTGPEQEVIYYWYDRGVLRENGDDKLVMDAIKNHDFDMFMKFREKYPKDGDFVYFPDTAAVFDKKTEDYVGSLDITTKENFNKIDDTDYEWG